jgi:G3E family GTPase
MSAHVADLALPAQPIPVTVIGGYLGAGKTTLINHVLRHADGLKLAVLVNDFGALPIDADLIESRDGNTVSIAGGCVCCSYGNGLMDAMIDLVQRRPKPDHVLLETSGVALPGPVAAAIGLLSDYVIDAVVVLANAETIRQQGTDRYLADTIERQLADANLIILNKTDLVDDAHRCKTERWIAGKATRARILALCHGAVDVDVIIGSKLGYTSPPSSQTYAHGAGQYITRSFAISCLRDVGGLAEALSNPALGILRAKGILTDSRARTWIVQMVGARSHIALAPEHAAKAGGLVVIGLKDKLAMPIIIEIVAAATIAREEPGERA